MTVITVAATVVIGGTTAGIAYSASADGSASPRTAHVEPVSKDISSDARTALIHAQAALSAGGFNVQLDAVPETNCAAHSYGLVEDYFKTHSCKWLARAYLAVRRGTQGFALVAVAWVDMPSVPAALGYKHLVDGSGTGNITELSRDIGPYRSVRYTGQFYSSGIVGSEVWNIQVQPVDSALAASTDQILVESRQ